MCVRAEANEWRFSELSIVLGENFTRVATDDVNKDCGEIEKEFLKGDTCVCVI